MSLVRPERSEDPGPFLCPLATGSRLIEHVAGFRRRALLPPNVYLEARSGELLLRLLLGWVLDALGTLMPSTLPISAGVESCSEKTCDRVQLKPPSKTRSASVAARSHGFLSYPLPRPAATREVGAVA
jgi:hypothetical protein